MRGNQQINMWIPSYAISHLANRQKSVFLKESSTALPAFLYLLFLGFQPTVQKGDFLLAFITWEQ